MKRHTEKSAKLAVIRRLLQSPAGRVELDRLLGWTNAPQCIKLLRSRFNIETTLDHERRAVYSLPATEKAKAYAFLGTATRRQDGGTNPL